MGEMYILGGEMTFIGYQGLSRLL